MNPVIIVIETQNELHTQIEFHIDFTGSARARKRHTKRQLCCVSVESLLNRDWVAGDVQNRHLNVYNTTVCLGFALMTLNT